MVKMNGENASDKVGVTAPRPVEMQRSPVLHCIGATPSLSLSTPFPSSTAHQNPLSPSPTPPNDTLPPSRPSTSVAFSD